MKREGVNIRLNAEEAVITLYSGFTVAFQKNGSIRVEKPLGVALRYSPSRLENTEKATNPFLSPEGERIESEQIIKVEENIMLELRTSRTEKHTKAELLFRVNRDGESVFSGVIADWVNGDWTIGFRQMDMLLTLLEKVFLL